MTPERLRELAEWFDDPKNKEVFVDMTRFGGKHWSAGFLLRRIADAMETDG